MRPNVGTRSGGELHLDLNLQVQPSLRRYMTAKTVSVHIVVTNHRSDVVSTTNVQLEKTWCGYEATVALP
jgi:hypothetical protein